MKALDKLPFFGKVLSLRQFSMSRYFHTNSLLVIALLTACVGLVAGASLPANSSSGLLQQDNEQVASLQAIELCLHNEYQTEIFYTAEVIPARRAALAFQQSGRIISIKVDEGDAVASDQLLASMDQRQIDAREKQLKAELSQAEVMLTELRNGPRKETIRAARAQVADVKQQFFRQQNKLERNERLFEQNAISRESYEQSLYGTRALQAKLDLAQSQLDELEAGTRLEQIDAQIAAVDAIKASLESVNYDRQDSEIKAPFAGLIVSRQLDEGEIVSPNNKVLEIIEHQKLEVHVGLPRAVSQNLSIGDSVNIIAGDWTGKASVKALVGELNSATRTQNVILSIVNDEKENDDKKAEQQSSVIAGQTVRVRFSAMVEEAGFWVPTTALISDHRGLWSCFVWRSSDDSSATGQASNGRVRRQSVEVIHQGNEKSYVRGTLEDGEWLVISGVHRLTDRQRVRVTKTVAAAGPSNQSSQERNK